MIPYRQAAKGGGHLTIRLSLRVALGLGLIGSVLDAVTTHLDFLILGRGAETNSFLAAFLGTPYELPLQACFASLIAGLAGCGYLIGKRYPWAGYPLMAVSYVLGIARTVAGISNAGVLLEGQVLLSPNILFPAYLTLMVAWLSYACLSEKRIDEKWLSW